MTSLLDFAQLNGSLQTVLQNRGLSGLDDTIGGAYKIALQGIAAARNESPQSKTTTRPSHSFEQVFAQLTPFVYPSNLDTNHPLAPIAGTGGLAFPYNPSISEGVSVKYDQIDLTHSNEGYYAYRGTDNVRITISDAVWTCDTFDNAVYALSVLHFLRSYSLMDFGRGRTGRPPSPMWFSAYGNYAFNRVPVLFEKADWSFPNDIDYVGVPEPNTPEFNSGYLETNRSVTGAYTWLPVKFTVSSISLIVQHTPRYWINFSLEDYYSGAMLARNGGSGTFHTTNTPEAAGNITPATIITTTLEN
jgi:hypothetical protein